VKKFQLVRVFFIPDPCSVCDILNAPLNRIDCNTINLNMSPQEVQRFVINNGFTVPNLRAPGPSPLSPPAEGMIY